MNFLEQLVVEYYSYLGYWVHHNVRLSQLCGTSDRREIDVVALHIGKKDLVQAEVGGGYEALADLSPQYKKKADACDAAISMLYPGVPLPKLRRVAIWEAAGKSTSIDGWEVIPLTRFLHEVDAALPSHDYSQRSVPERYPILRAFHLARWLRKPAPEKVAAKVAAMSA